MRVIHIPSNTDQNMVVLDVPRGFPALNEALLEDGTCLIEQVYARGLHELAANHGSLQFVLLIDEEGLLKGLPLNKRASILYGTHVHGQPIVGEAYVVAATDEDWTDVPADIYTGTVGLAILSSMFKTEQFA